MKIEELLARESIRSTMERYVSAVDRGCYSELSEVFMPDGIMMFGEKVRYEGRNAIISGMTENAQKRGAHNELSFQRHLLGQSLINVIDSDNARAVTYIVSITELGFDLSGVYVDDFARSGDKWLVAKRHAHIEWGHPESKSVKYFKPSPAPRHMLDIGFSSNLG